MILTRFIVFSPFLLSHFLAEGTNKVGNTTTTTVVEQDEQPNLLDILNDPGYIERHYVKPLVDDVYDLVPSRNDPQAEVTPEPQRYSTSTYSSS